MTGALRGAAERAAATPSHPLPFDKRRLAIELAEARLAGAGMGGEAKASEPWARFAARLDWERLDRALPREIARAIGEIWADPSRAAHAAPLARFGAGCCRKSWDRALLYAYLRVFPVDHPAFEALVDSAKIAAGRHDWPWRARGKIWRMWNPGKGPLVIAEALLREADPAEVLRQAGLEADRAEGGFAAAALTQLCLIVGGECGATAESHGARLVAIFDTLGATTSDALLAHALLNPWLQANPSAEHKRAMAALLVKRLGDPRLAPAARWQVVESELAARGSGFDGVALTAVLRRWLTEQAVRAFFKIVGLTTNDPKQWASREAFWLAYLDADLITDAWFAFGRNAEAKAGSLAREQNLRHGRVVGGCDPSHSSLILTIGDLRIAEWSHNGKCRFWPASSASAPQLFKYEYDGTKLRTEFGPRGFAAISHTGNDSQHWQRKFAGHIYHATKIKHPKFGAGSAQ